MPRWLIQIVRHKRLIHLTLTFIVVCVCTDLSLVHKQITAAVSRYHSNYLTKLAYRYSLF